MAYIEEIVKKVIPLYQEMKKKLGLWQRFRLWLSKHIRFIKPPFPIKQIDDRLHSCEQFCSVDQMSSDQISLKNQCEKQYDMIEQFTTDTVLKEIDCILQHGKWKNWSNKEQIPQLLAYIKQEEMMMKIAVTIKDPAPEKDTSKTFYYAVPYKMPYQTIENMVKAITKFKLQDYKQNIDDLNRLENTLTYQQHPIELTDISDYLENVAPHSDKKNALFQILTIVSEKASSTVHAIWKSLMTLKDCSIKSEYSHNNMTLHDVANVLEKSKLEGRIQEALTLVAKEKFDELKKHNISATPSQGITHSQNHENTETAPSVSLKTQKKQDKFFSDLATPKNKTFYKNLLDEIETNGLSFFQSTHEVKANIDKINNALYEIHRKLNQKDLKTIISLCVGLRNMLKNEGTDIDTVKEYLQEITQLPTITDSELKNIINTRKCNWLLSPTKKLKHNENVLKRDLKSRRYVVKQNSSRRKNGSTHPF